MKVASISWIVQIIAAAIFIQTLYFKFTAAPESVYIFAKLGIEPYGRIGSGIVELIASVLILMPRTVLLGAIVGLGVISGAIMSHLLVLGIEVQEDGGTLFILALVIFICCSVLIYLHKKQIPNLLKLKL